MKPRETNIVAAAWIDHMPDDPSYRRVASAVIRDYVLPREISSETPRKVVEHVNTMILRAAEIIKGADAK